uniref:Uncharacterized protein n=1 Tax=Amphimedon queenslandica TaxID=400682 RepID=A0A1X7SLG6_AMPQE
MFYDGLGSTKEQRLQIQKNCHLSSKCEPEGKREFLGRKNDDFSNSQSRYYPVFPRPEDLVANCDGTLKAEVTQLAAQYQAQSQLGSKAIFHLEAFTAKFMRIYKQFLEEGLESIWASDKMHRLLNTQMHIIHSDHTIV